MSRVLVSVLVLLMFSPLLAAQTSSSGNCDLSVRVLTTDERTIESPIRIEVLSSQGVIATLNITGGDPAQFRVANGRTYRLSVTGASIESVMTPYFQINSLEPIHTEVVHVKSVKQKSDGESAQGFSTISVSEMNIPKKATTEMNKGMDAYSKGDMEKAGAHFESALTEYPGYARANHMLGLIAIKGSDRVKARELFAKAMQVDGTFVPAYVDLARMDVQEQNYAASESLLTKAIAMNPSMPDAVALLATTEFANKEYEKGLADVQRTHALRNHEQFAEVHLMAGKVLRMQNRPNAAIEQFQFFLMEKPDSPQAESVRQDIASLEAGRQH